MLQIIRKGDKTTHGGSVMTCSGTMIFGGIGVARKGDRFPARYLDMVRQLSSKVTLIILITGSRLPFTVINVAVAAH
jgi:uncharacterized Zn-binding protein involved in type VI secretion